MKTTALTLALTLAVPALAQDLGLYNKALSAFNSGNYDQSAELFFEVNNTATDPDLRTKSEYYLASSFQKKGLPVTAFVYFEMILKAGKSHPFYLKAVEGLVNVQEQLEDQEFIPKLLDRNYNEDWVTLPAEILSHINFQIGAISWRYSKFDDARSFLEAVPQESTMYCKAQYLLGVVLADPRFPGDLAKNKRQAIDAFEKVMNTKLQGQKDLVVTQQLAMLALGRVYYGDGQYQKATEWYERVPRFSKYWDQALFENGFARFQNDDMGGGLGSLQALHAPQFSGAFQPESWVLTGTIYYYSCLYEEARTALAEFDALYLPMAEKLKPLVEGDAQDPVEYFKLVDTTDSDRIPRAVLNNVRSNERMLSLFRTLKQIDFEKKLIEENQGWRSAKLSSELIPWLDGKRAQARQRAGSLAEKGVKDAYHTVKGFTDTAEIIRFETAKAEKELAESGVDQRAVLKKQTLYRPQMPAENWNYWKFQGEFWRDEIGYYQYTLKKGCPVSAE